METGWQKDMPEGKRRELVLKAHKGDELAAARSMISLSNVTTDKETHAAARSDGLHFLKEYTNKKRVGPDVAISRTIIMPRTPRITPRMPRLE